MTADGIFQRRTQLPTWVGSMQMLMVTGSMSSYGTDGNISYHHKLNDKMNLTLRANYTYPPYGHQLGTTLPEI